MRKITQPVSLRAIRIKNAVARSATNDYMSDASGEIPPAQVEVYRTLARNQVGLIITGHYFVSSPLGQAKVGQSAGYDDRFLPGLCAVAQAGKEDGARIVAQISHAGAKSRVGETPVAPSAVSAGDGIVPRPLTKEEIRQIETDFVEAAVRMKRAGFDGVQLHCAHSYLLSQFLDPVYNRRSDEYGGSPENRFRIVREIFEGIRGVLPDYPILVKINGSTTGDNESYQADFRYYLEELDALGAEAVELSGAVFSPAGKSEGPYFIDQLREIKERTGLPILLVGGMRNLEDMETALDAGAAMVSLSRPLICEPDLILKLLSGQPEAKCIRCNRCFSIYPAEQRSCVQHPKP